MTVCKVCKMEMITADGCGIGEVIINGEVYERIKHNAENDVNFSIGKGDRCHDCGATFGNNHHWGCDAEICPACGLQLIGCECEEVSI